MKVFIVVTITNPVDTELYADVVLVTKDEDKAAQVVKALQSRDSNVLKKYNIDIDVLADYENATYFSKEVQ